MDIHKPKPWHSFREFMKEYLIIVVGVLTALAAEAGVEWLHWRHNVESARASLIHDYLRIIETGGERDALTPCVFRRLDEIAALVETGRRTGRLPPVGTTAPPPGRPWGVPTYEEIIPAQILTHMPQTEALTHSANASFGGLLNRRREDEYSSWVTLRILAGPSRPFDAAEAGHMSELLANAARDAGFFQRGARSLSKRIMTLAYMPHAEAAAAWNRGVVRGRTADVCKPMGPPPHHLSDTLDRPDPDDSAKAPF